MDDDETKRYDELLQELLIDQELCCVGTVFGMLHWVTFLRCVHKHFLGEDYIEKGKE